MAYLWVVLIWPPGYTIRLHLETQGQRQELLHDIQIVYDEPTVLKKKVRGLWPFKKSLIISAY